MSSPFRAMMLRGVPVQTDPRTLVQNVGSPVKTGCGFHDVREILRSAGLRPTRQRIMLGWLLFGRGHRHLTAEMLYDEACEAKISVSLATVYNTLHQFREAGLLRQLAVDGTKSYFDTNIAEHHHFFVEDDQTLVDIPDGLISVAGLPEAPEGMEIVCVEVIVRVKRKAAKTAASSTRGLVEA
ncbi:Fur family iron response transcriptional regulator [Pseudochelatococcus lubricantis]|uniref:Fur family iron response transcriptional regulator n=1 Tax=Pseudochelatococcus lubricantis TaxID=1538102 RepID=A0ABX0UTW3_9HYPH|nr:Fur family transcriptional regulator [Pseudochelatococcus lubricantis]NIJ56402.1 Fur family iron response transcriptional regulator [Pseudochelatococcus lubricantis]